MGKKCLQKKTPSFHAQMHACLQVLKCMHARRCTNVCRCTVDAGMHAGAQLMQAWVQVHSWGMSTVNEKSEVRTFYVFQTFCVAGVMMTVKYTCFSFSLLPTRLVTTCQRRRWCVNSTGWWCPPWAISLCWAPSSCESATGMTPSVSRNTSLEVWLAYCITISLSFSLCILFMICIVSQFLCVLYCFTVSFLFLILASVLLCSTFYRNFIVF